MRRANWGTFDHNVSLGRWFIHVLLQLNPRAASRHTERLYLLAGLGTPWDSPEEQGESSWGEKNLGFLAVGATPVTPDPDKKLTLRFSETVHLRVINDLQDKVATHQP